MVPLSRLVGFVELSLAAGKSVTALSTAASRKKLPLTIFRVGHIVTFDAEEVAAWVAAGYPTAADWKKAQASPKDGAAPRLQASPSRIEPNFSGSGCSLI